MNTHGWRGRLHSSLDGIREVCKLEFEACITLVSWIRFLVADII